MRLRLFSALSTTPLLLLQLVLFYSANSDVKIAPPKLGIVATIVTTL
jgi:hypothetical protein